MDDERTRRLLTDQIERLWGGGQTDLVAVNYHPQVRDHMPVAGQPGGLKGLVRVVEDFRAAFPDLTMTLEGTIACGRMGADWWRMEGTHLGPLGDTPPTGKRVSIRGIDIVRTDGERITDLWHVEEMLQMDDQLGLTTATFGQPAEAGARPSGPHDPGAGAAVPAAESLTELERRNLDIGRRHIERIWALGDEAVAWELYHSDVVDISPAPGQAPGVPGILEVLQWLREAAPDLRMSIKEYLVEGEHVAERWEMVGTHTGGPLLGLPALGRPFAISGMDVIRVTEEGRIDRVWHVEEFASLRRQIA